MNKSEIGINLFLDNTTIHRIGHVLNQKAGANLRPVDGLALFHLAEHIMYSRSVVISNFETLPTFTTTSEVLEKLNNEGFTNLSTRHDLFSLVPFTEEAYDEACSHAAWRVLDELTAFNSKTLRDLGKSADETTRPHNIPQPSIDDWLNIETSPDRFDSQVSELRSNRASGSFKLMLIRCEPLRKRISKLRSKKKRDRDLQSAALSALMRVHINEELAKLKNAVYSPAPRRARIAGGANNLFRHKLEMQIQAQARNQYDAPESPSLRIMVEIDRLPLPLFAFHELRTAKTNSPEAFLEAARLAREQPKVSELRSWLTSWEQAYSSNDQQKKLKALGEIEMRKIELEKDLKGHGKNIFASLHLGGSFEYDPISGAPTWKPPLSELGLLGVNIIRRYNRKRLYIAALAKDLIADKALGANVLNQVGFGVKNK